MAHLVALVVRLNTAVLAGLVVLVDHPPRSWRIRHWVAAIAIAVALIPLVLLALEQPFETWHLVVLVVTLLVVAVGALAAELLDRTAPPICRLRDRDPDDLDDWAPNVAALLYDNDGDDEATVTIRDHQHGLTVVDPRTLTRLHDAP